MATRRDQPVPPAPMTFAASPRDLQPMRQHWQVTSAMPDRFRSTDQLLASRFRRVPDDDEFLPPPAAAPVLPTIASLLSSSARGPSRPDDRRKLPVQVRERPPQTAAATSAGPQLYAALRPRETAAFNRQQVERIRRLASSSSSSSCSSPPPDWERRYADASSRMPSAMRQAMYREFGPRARGVAAPVAAREEEEEEAAVLVAESRSRVRPTPASRYMTRDPSRGHEAAERRRLYYHHSIDPHKIHEIHVPAEIPVPTLYHDDLPSRYRHLHHETSPPRARPVYYEVEEVNTTAHKRRRVSPSTAAPPVQPLYESEYGLNVLETSKPLVRPRYVASRESDAYRRRYVRGGSHDLEKVNSPLAATSRISYSGDKGLVRTSLAETSTPPPMPRSLPVVDAERTEHTPLTTLVLKSKEFLKSKSLVRNRHDEIDWVATFLKVGFDSYSIYALMCPLRKGRWKSEEEKFTMGLLRLIENGTILLRHGQSIRGYIGEKLHSDDMRVLKKLSNCKMFHFAKLINPRLAEEEQLDMTVAGAREGMERLNQLKGEFLRSVQLEALVAVRKYLSDSSLRDLLNVRA
ncbi:hypothetical protein PR001_g8387 [Phytophthora rubi]|uniref:Uncharacterized protein n=1 Tax=Phytophthora rubi TaxID=129364 RepID=A0A6A3N8S0_9STRA|nr:hypothetical protein PR001_g8387 [Phytophthora rubi]